MLRLDATIVNGFQGSLLASRYDDPKPTPDFHIALWELCCSDETFIACAAPRGHAKSTAVTHAYVLAAVLFRDASNVMIVSDTEDQAIQFLNDIKLEIEENEALREEFHINRFVRESQKQIVVSIGEDGHQFRIFIKGAGKSLRGSKWRSKRPDLIIGDDMENDEMVENPERRKKLKKWLLKALVPMLADKGRIRLVGTVLHSDSLLEYALTSKLWKSYRFKAHNADFSEILWPDKFSKQRLLKLRAVFEEAGELDGYSQEYLNEPIDETTALFHKEDFIPIPEEENDEYLEYYIGGDFAISKKTSADYTVFVVLGITKAGKKRVVNVVRGRLDTLEIIDQIFELQLTYKPQFFIFEDENINKALGPVLYEEMDKREIFPLVELVKPSSDKIIRARPLIAQVRAKQLQFDTEAFWFSELQLEMLQFPRGKKDDQVDSLGSIFLKLRQLFEATTESKEPDAADEEEDDDYFDEYDYMSDDELGRCAETGY